MKRSTKVFIAAAIVWEIAVAIIYGLFIRYNQTAFASMQTVTNQYYFADDSNSFRMYQANASQMPNPMVVVTIIMIFLLVGNSATTQDSPSFRPTSKGPASPTWPSPSCSSPSPSRTSSSSETFGTGPLPITPTPPKITQTGTTKN